MGNHILGDKIKLKKNNGDVTVMGNDISGDLVCKNNAGFVLVSNNVVGGKAKGQCALP